MINSSGLSGIFGKKGPTPAQLNKNEPSKFHAGGKTFDSLESVGQAVEKNDIKFNSEGEVRVREKAWQPEKAESTRNLSKILFGTAGVLLAATAVAGTGGAAAPVLFGMMGTMIAGGVGEGMRQAANEFDKAPQIKDQGHIQSGPNGLTYQSFDNDTQKPLVMLDE
jgi:hypothetical protein